jgi:hypothetical protein
MKKVLTAPAAGLACANAGCTNTVERRPRGRQKRFCSDNCRIRAHRISLQAAPNSVPEHTALSSDHSNAPGDFPAKNGHSVTSKINALQSPPNRGSAISRGGVQGPKSAVQAELINVRKWTEVTSSKGVKSFASRLTKSALRASSRQASKNS